MAQTGSRAAGAQSTPPAEQTETTPAPPAEVSADAGRVAELEAENARLSEELAAAKAAKPTRQSKAGEPDYVTALVDALVDGKPLDFGDAEVPAAVERRLRAAGRLTNRPVEPSFGLSEGQRAELEATGKTVSPFTGQPQVGTGKPGAKARAVSADEFVKTPATPQAPARDKQ